MAGIKEELSARRQKIYELLGEGKNKEVLEYYTEDCVIMPPGREAVQGKEAYLKLIEASAELQSKVGKTDNVELEVYGEGDVVTSRNKSTVYGKDGSVIVQTKGLTVWKKVDGDYLVHNIVWNADEPFSL